MDLTSKTGVELAGIITGISSGIAGIARADGDDAIVKLAEQVERAGWEVLHRLDPAAHAEFIEWRKTNPEEGSEQLDGAGTD